MDQFVRLAKKKILRCILFPFRFFSIKNNRILLHNDLAYNYSGNIKVISEYLLKAYPNELEVIVSVRNLQNHVFLLKKKVRIVKFNSIKYFFYAMTSNVLVTNSGGFSYIPLRKKQFVINTWHGGGAYKKCGIHMYNDSKTFRNDLTLSAYQTNVFLSTCKRFSKVFNESMLIPQNIFWEIGMPRNDMLIHEDKVLKNNVRKKLGLNEDEKLVLFAPTYRKVADNYFKDSVAISYGIDTKRVCKALHERFGGKWKFAIRFHPCVVNKNEKMLKNILDLSDYPDMQELLLAADVMINDFSSSMWDFMLTRKPSFLFAIDLDHYIETTKVYTPVSEWPFPKATTNDELEKNILNFNQKKYLDNCKNHYKDLGGSETGKATQLVCELIYEQCVKNK